MFVTVIVFAHALLVSLQSYGHFLKLTDLILFLQCFDTVGWAAGRASGL